MDDKEADLVFNLVKSVFKEFVQPDLTEEGTKEFFRAAHEFIQTRPENHFTLVAITEGRIIGMIDILDNHHISLFFVSKDCHRFGVGRKLIENAIAHCSEKQHHQLEIDVNSSTYAVETYRKLGFVQISEEQVINGIRFVPMKMLIEKEHH